jgi:hypothetical protein
MCRMRKDPLDPIDGGTKVRIALRRLLNPEAAKVGLTGWEGSWVEGCRGAGVQGLWVWTFCFQPSWVAGWLPAGVGGEDTVAER